MKFYILPLYNGLYSFSGKFAFFFSWAFNHNPEAELQIIGPHLRFGFLSNETQNPNIDSYTFVSRKLSFIYCKYICM